MIINNRIIIILGRKPRGRRLWGQRETRMYRLKQDLARLWRDQSGISSVEYALLLAFIAAGIIAAADLLSNAVENEMTDTATCIETNGATCG